MGKTIVEKILNRAGRTHQASAGDIINAHVSWVMTNDAVAELTMDAFCAMGKAPWNPDRIAVVLDHYIPATTENAARIHFRMRDFAGAHGLHLLDQEGVCHQLMIERFVKPGDVVIGTDSHTCTYGGMGAFATGVGSTDGAAAMATGQLWLKIPETIRVVLSGHLPPHVHAKDIILKIISELGADGATYKALEFSGPGAAAISMAGRYTICNMAIEAGAKTGIFAPDEVTAAAFPQMAETDRFFESDPDAVYCRTLEIDLDRLTPRVASPWAVDSGAPAASATEVKIHQAFIGSCTNGRIEDLETVGRILENRRIAQGIRLLVTPASKAIYREAMAKGLLETFVQAGAVILNPGCSACFGGQGMLWDGEVCIGTHNRNFRGRMGHKNAKVYLASPETVACSAITGHITDPVQFHEEEG